MNRLDKMIRKRRVKQYKKLRKLFRARDMATKYIKGPVRVSVVLAVLGPEDIILSTTTGIAKRILDYKERIMFEDLSKPPAPPVTKKASITRLPEGQGRALKPPTPPMGPQPAYPSIRHKKEPPRPNFPDLELSDPFKRKK